MTTGATLPRRAWVEQIMGLPVSIHLRGPDTAQVHDLVAACFAVLRHADAVFSPYRGGSDLSCWERGELAAGAADPTFTEVLALCDEAHTTAPAAGSTRATCPTRALVRGDLTHRTRERVGGAAAAAHLRQLHRYSWCLNAGGDVVVHAEFGHPAWRIGIEFPDDPQRLIQVIERRSGAVATSGPRTAAGTSSTRTRAGPPTRSTQSP